MPYKAILKQSAMILILAGLNKGFAMEDVTNTVALNSQVANSNVVSSSTGNATDWNLTEEEWKKYQKLIHGPAGYYFPQLTPPEMLGYYAENDEEERHYAEIYAKIEHDNVGRDLKFDKAFHEAAVRLYSAEPIIKPFDITPYSPIKKNNNQSLKALVAGDHLVLFIDIKQSSQSYIIPELIEHIKANDGVVLDIYCLNANKGSDIQTWAKNNEIPINFVMTNRITLNIDDGKYKQIVGSGNLPSLVLSRDGRAESITLESLL